MIIRRDSIKPITESLSHLHEIDIGSEVGEITSRHSYKQALTLIMARWQRHHNLLAAGMQDYHKMSRDHPEAHGLKKALDKWTVKHTKLTDDIHSLSAEYAKRHGGRDDKMSVRSIAAAHMSKRHAASPHHFVNHLSNFMLRRVHPMVKERVDKHGRLGVDLKGPESHEAVGHLKSLLAHHNAGEVADHRITKSGDDERHKLSILPNATQ